MRKKIVKSYLLIFLISYAAALLVLYLSMARVFTNIQRTQLFDEIEWIQYQDIGSNTGDYLKKHSNLRYTVISKNGKVIYDNMKSEIDENHLYREEIKQAKATGKGTSIRYSTTMKRVYLYAAVYDKNNQRFLRLGMPYQGVRQFAAVVIPSLAAAGVAALAITWILSRRMSHSIVEPLKRISTTVRETRIGHEELKFDESSYPEVQQIENTLQEMNDEIKAYILQLENEKRVRQEFFSNASHELKTPLTSVRGYAELLRAHAIQEPAQVDHCLDCILDESDHMTRLIQDIMAISKLETGQLEVKREYVAIKPLLEQVVKNLSVNAKNLRFRVLCQDIDVYADRKHMQMLFNNLISNAIKYNKPNGSVLIQAYHKKSDFVFAVEDSGIGISEEDQARIFQRFFRVDKQRSKSIPGTGLGLSIVKHIAVTYQGTIDVNSKLQEGTRITVTLPIYTTNKEFQNEKQMTEED
ncbi:sensor histidine kinase [Catenisphaera adipataccumulans]|jgi:two-component system phosphate regulon sensor histidine kinase PhoR|uniref:histidine kinase n=1 Tax=Catenisphaera adipataccumulans TaxID=700500 RepID=A0A7W8FW45_9FIRM|nr:HAMP domain-containing sensor histidine kinase [Catenisphaera adipataccumulans]MBB5182876.1 two-component system phosphate regulon sensor histidine kinase PhoR [Catenisphaera adipataccumulans]